MKRVFFFILLIVVNNISFSQNRKTSEPGKTIFSKSGQLHLTQSTTAPYTFSYSTGSYNDLTGSTALNGGLTWDDPNYYIPLGFSFILWNDTITGLYTDDLGAMLDPGSSGQQPLILYSCDVADRGCDTATFGGTAPSLSKISYLTSGTPGNRICKIEWNNTGFYEDILMDNLSTDFVNLQVWLYEGTNNVEMRFGPSYITQDSLVYWELPGPAIGIGEMDFGSGALDFLGLTGSAAAPDTILFHEDTFITVIGDPANGIIYKFSWSQVGINEYDALDQYASVYPNPAEENTTITWKNKNVPHSAGLCITDLAGRTVMEQNCSFDHTGKTNLHLETLAPGSYLLLINTGEKVVYKKIVKQ